MRARGRFIADPLKRIRELFPAPEWLKQASFADQGWTYAEVAVELARTKQLQRRLLGQRMFEKAVLAGEDGREHFFAARLPSGTWFVFVASPQPRPERVLRATLLAHALKQKRKVDRVLGVATEPAQSESRTYDFWLVDIPYAPDPDFEAQFETVFAGLQEVTTYEFPGT